MGLGIGLGRSWPPLTPRLFSANSARLILARTAGLCRSVLSIISEKAQTYAASASTKGPGASRYSAAAKACMMRSTFCASPGMCTAPKMSRSAWGGGGHQVKVSG